MTISARNQFDGIIKAIIHGSVNGIVIMEVNGVFLYSILEMETIRQMGLEPEKPAKAVIKATEVLVGTGDFKISAKNQVEGVISYIEQGAVCSIVHIDTPAGMFSSTLENGAVELLDLKPGQPAKAVVNATALMIAC